MIRWTTTFMSLTGETFTVNIYDSTYTGTATTLVAGANPIVIEEDDDTDLLTPYRIKTGTLTLVETVFGALNDLRPQYNGQYMVELLRLEGYPQEDTVIFRGFIQSEDFDCDYKAAPREVSLHICSPLATIESVKFNNILPAKMMTLGEVWKEIFDKINADYTMVEWIVIPTTYVEALAWKLNSLVICPFGKNDGPLDEAATYLSPIYMIDFVEGFANLFAMQGHEVPGGIVFSKLDYMGTYTQIAVSDLVESAPQNAQGFNDDINPGNGNTEPGTTIDPGTGEDPGTIVDPGTTVDPGTGTGEEPGTEDPGTGSTEDPGTGTTTTPTTYVPSGTVLDVTGNTISTFASLFTYAGEDNRQSKLLPLQQLKVEGKGDFVESIQMPWNRTHITQVTGSWLDNWVLADLENPTNEFYSQYKGSYGGPGYPFVELAMSGEMTAQVNSVLMRWSDSWAQTDIFKFNLFNKFSDPMRSSLWYGHFSIKASVRWTGYPGSSAAQQAIPKNLANVDRGSSHKVTMSWYLKVGSKYWASVNGTWQWRNSQTGAASMQFQNSGDGSSTGLMMPPIETDIPMQLICRISGLYAGELFAIDNITIETDPKLYSKLENTDNYKEFNSPYLSSYREQSVDLLFHHWPSSNVLFNDNGLASYGYGHLYSDYSYMFVSTDQLDLIVRSSAMHDFIYLPFITVDGKQYRMQSITYQPWDDIYRIKLINNSTIQPVQS